MTDLLTVTGRLVRFDLRRFVVGALLWIPTSVLPLLTGLILQAVFNQISNGRGVAMATIGWLCAALVATEVLRSGLTVIAHTYGAYWWDAAAAMLRGNVLRSLATANGSVAGRMPRSSGESLARLRSDVAVLVDFVDAFIPITGSVLFAVGALVIMAHISALITLVVIVPLATIGILSSVAAPTVRRLQQRVQAAAAEVTAFIGELFHGLLAITTAGVQTEAIERLRAHNAPRRHAAVRNRLATDLLNSATAASVEVAIGLVLLLSARSMYHGTFTVGDLALFTTYVGWLAALPRMIGAQLYQVPQAIVATERLTALLEPHTPVTDLTADTRVWFGDSDPLERPPPPRDHAPFRHLEVRDLTVGLGPDVVAVQDVAFTVHRGTLTVLTGSVGSGKSTVLRAVLGLIPADTAELVWNSLPIGQDNGDLVPPRTAFSSQTGTLLSASLRENVVAGWPDPDPEHALWIAAFDHDLADLTDDLDTAVGPAGTRLSGGQARRVVTARALVREPDLLVLDDPTSALDLDTEHQFWQRLHHALGSEAGPRAVLAASHRRAALEQADHIIVLDGGRVVGAGTLPDLLATCPQMGRLWADELDLETTLD